MLPDHPAPVSTRQRIKGAADPKFVRGLLQDKAQAREEWLISALQMHSRQALLAVEEAIAQMAGQSDILFYKPVGVVPLNSQQENAVMEQVLEMARRSQLLTDIAYTQSLMPRVGKSNNRQIMFRLVDISPRGLHIYQLLGVQMQLAIMAAPFEK